jgi:cell pole-organizing protein PopZ
MSEMKPQQEPSMEEILASIRRIISEDGSREDDREAIPRALPPPSAEVRDGPPNAPDDQDEVPTDAPAEPAEDEDVLELTDVVEDDPGEFEAEPAPSRMFAIEQDAESEEDAEPVPRVKPAPEVPRAVPRDRPDFGLAGRNNDQDAEDSDHGREADDDHLVSAATAAATADAFARLMQEPRTGSAPVTGAMPLGDGSKTLEDLVRELLRPMLREWLDQNLRDVVERIVEREVERMVQGIRRR